MYILFRIYSFKIYEDCKLCVFVFEGLVGFVYGGIGSEFWYICNVCLENLNCGLIDVFF